MGNIVSTAFSKSAITSNSSVADYFEDFDDDSNDIQRKHLLKNQLIDYMRHLAHQKDKLSDLEKSFLLVVKASVINIIGKKQCESYQYHGSFNGTDLKIMSSICKIPHFDVDKYSEVKRLVEPLKPAFKINSFQKLLASIERMKQYNDHQGLLLSTIDYKLLDILEYITKFCMNKERDSKGALVHWTNIFDILFRGTNVKVSNRRSTFSVEHSDHECNQIPSLNNRQQKKRLDSTDIVTKDSILFQCLCHSSFSQQELVEISACSVSYRNNDDTEQQFSEKEAVFQSHSILINKAIFEKLRKDYSNIDENTIKDIYPLGIHLSEFDGYIYSIRQYKGVYVASQACENILFIPKTIDEFEIFLYKSRVLEMLCNLKRHYLNVAKVIRHASVNKNVWAGSS